MSLEKENKSAIETLHAFNAEHVWGGEEWEWKNWENAQRYMDSHQYNLKQMEEMVSIKTREAFMSEEHREPESDDQLGEFFVRKGGARWFKRRFFQYRSDRPEEEIRKYYQNREWETKEKDDHV